MELSGIKINYLYNSGFVVETENYQLIFDFYLNSVDSGAKRIENGAITIDDLNYNKKIFVFSSHSHEDHYNPVVLEWEEINPEINYILSSDIEYKGNSKNVHKLSAYESMMLRGVSIKTFGSTDIGISFLVKLDGISIFHAGDLNLWHWWDSTEEENREAEGMFKSEIQKIKGENVDIAFFPVDNRLKEYYYLGGEYFIKVIEPKIFVPMHFREAFEVTKEFARKEEKTNTRIVEISKRGQEIVL